MSIKKYPIVIATWQRSGVREWDGRGYSALDTCSSTQLSLRTAKPRADWHNDHDSAVSDLAVRVWFSKESLSVDIVVTDVHGKDEKGLEYLLKTMKALRRKVAKNFRLNQFIDNEDPTVVLAQFFQAAGITECVIYPESYSQAEYEYANVLSLAGRVGKYINEVRSTFKERYAA